MRKRLLAVIVTLAGFGGLAALPTTAAQAAPKCPPHHGKGSVLCQCPSGNGHTHRCVCPPGNDGFAKYCTVEPQGPPTVFDDHIWGAKHHKPWLAFHLKKGINGSTNLKKLVLYLPTGLRVGNKHRVEVWAGSHKIKKHHRRLVITLTHSLAKVYLDFKRGSLFESKKLQREISSGTVTSVTFNLTVYDRTGHKTKLAFVVTV